MVDVAIRGVEEDVWAEFKSRAASRKMSIPDYLKNLLDETKNQSNWKEIFFGKKFLDEKTAEEIEKASKNIRKNFKMRDFDWQ